MELAGLVLVESPGGRTRAELVARGIGHGDSSIRDIDPPHEDIEATSWRGSPCAILILAICLALAGRAHAADALRTLEKSLTADSSHQERVAAIQGVAAAARDGTLSHRKAARALLTLTGRVDLAGEQSALVGALALLDDAEAAAALIAIAVDPGHLEDSVTAARALARNPAIVVEEVLVKGLDDRRWEVRAQSAISLGERGAYGQIDALIARLAEEKDIGARSALGEALEKMTLKVLPVDEDRWEAWRKENPHFQPAAPVGGGGVDGKLPEEPKPNESVALLRGPQKPRAYGIVPRFEHFEITGEVVLVAVDVSGSMLEGGARAREDARSLIKALPTHVEGMILAFAEAVDDMDGGFAPLSIARKKAICDLLDAKEKGGGTDFESAMLSAIDHARRWFAAHERDPRELDLVVFSDGVTTGRKARTAPEKVRDAIAKLTNQHAARMSFIGSTGTASAVMIELAELSGGSLVLGERPPQDGLLGR